MGETSRFLICLASAVLPAVVLTGANDFPLAMIRAAIYQIEMFRSSFGASGCENSLEWIAAYLELM